MPRDKAVVKKTTQLERFSMWGFVAVFSISLFFQIGWSLGYPIKDMEIWTSILRMSLTFFLGYLLGQNRDTRSDIYSM